jgi:hypothetical protein
LIDDEAGLRTMVRDTVEPLDHTIFEASNGLLGVQKFCKAPSQFSRPLP